MTTPDGTFPAGPDNCVTCGTDTFGRLCLACREAEAATVAYLRGPVPAPTSAPGRAAETRRRRNARRRAMDQVRRDLGLRRNRDGSWE